MKKFLIVAGAGLAAGVCLLAAAVLCSEAAHELQAKERQYQLLGIR